ncbi:MAG: hypothetical protein PVG45_08855 [Gammaproteobacteria bacterium]|jgi:hypothetical protein
MYKPEIHPVIKRSLAVFIVTLLLMIAVVIMSDMYKSKASDENALMMREMRSWRNKIDEANKNNQILVQHEETFKKLVEESVIGDENRLSWVEVVQNVVESRKLTSVKYDIASRVLLDKKLLDRKYSGIDVFRSVMSLDMKLIHEGDLFVMLNALRTEAKGLVTVDKCDIELINKNINEGVIAQDDTVNMSAYCELSWYTLKKADRG